MTDAADKLLATIRHIMHDSLDDIDDRNRAVLEAVDEYATNVTGVACLNQADYALLLSKARVCDALSAWEPEENRNSTSWARVSDALRAVRELEKTR